MEESPFRIGGRLHWPDGRREGQFFMKRSSLLHFLQGGFAFHLLSAVMLKEFIQMRRDRMTFGIMVGIPLVQLMLFGYAINSDPRHLPTAILMADQGPFARTFVSALKQSGYFQVVRDARTEAEAA